MASRPGGLNRYLHELHRALLEEGLPTRTVVLGSPGQSTADRVEVDGPSRPLVKRLLRLRSAASRSSRWADVADVHFALYGLLPLLTTALRRKPYVVHFHGPWAEEGSVARGYRPWVFRAKHFVEQIVYRRAACVITLSKAFAELVEDQYGIAADKVRIVPPGVDLESFTPGDGRSFRTLHGIDEDAFVVVCARRIETRMGIDVLLDAWSEVQERLPTAVLVIAGDGTQREALMARTALLPNPSGVRWLGRVSDDDLVQLYRMANCSVVPTRSLEGFGLVTLESLACGTAPIVTDVGGLPDGVAGLDASVVIPAEDVKALARRIIEAADGALPRPPACRAWAERFGWDEVARRHVEIYGSAAGTAPEGDRRVVWLDHSAVLSGGELAMLRQLPALTGISPRVILAQPGPLVGRMAEAGIPVEVLAMGADALGVRRDQVEVGRLPFRSAAVAAAHVVRLARRLRQLRPDVIVTNSLKAALYGGVAGRVIGVPVVWHIRDRIATDYLPAAAVHLVRFAGRWLPSAVIANSQTTLATLGDLRCPTTVIPSPIDPSLLDRPRPDPGDRPFTAAMVGRLAPWKGQDVFLRAFAQAFPAGPERAILVGGALFGEDDYERALMSLVAELGLTDRVELTGHVDDVASILDHADVAVHASIIPEPFGLVIVEAMAQGLPVIAANAGGPADIITHEHDGLLYPPGDANQLAAHLRYVAPLRQSPLGDNAQSTASRYAPSEIAISYRLLFTPLSPRAPL